MKNRSKIELTLLALAYISVILYLVINANQKVEPTPVVGYETGTYEVSDGKIKLREAE